MAPWLGIEGLAATHGTRAAVWVALCPVVSALIGRFRGSEILTRANIIGLGLGVTGGLLLTIDGATSGMGYGRGDIMLFAALILAVTELHLLQSVIQRLGALRVLAWRTAFGATVYLGIAAPSLVVQPWATLNGATWTAILFGGCIAIGLGHWVQLQSIPRIGPTRVVVYNNLVPFAAIFIGWLALGGLPSVLESVATNRASRD